MPQGKGSGDSTDRNARPSGELSVRRLPPSTSNSPCLRSCCVWDPESTTPSLDSQSHGSRSSWLLIAKEFTMYMPTLARFTARDPMPPDGEPVLLGRALDR